MLNRCNESYLSQTGPCMTCHPTIGNLCAVSHRGTHGIPQQMVSEVQILTERPVDLRRAAPSRFPFLIGPTMSSCSQQETTRNGSLHTKMRCCKSVLIKPVKLTALQKVVKDMRPSGTIEVQGTPKTLGCHFSTITIQDLGTCCMVVTATGHGTMLLQSYLNTMERMSTSE